MIDKEIIIEKVKDEYSELAKGASECCGVREGFASRSSTYDTGQIQGLPQEAIAASAGCGNPNAIGELRRGETVVDFGSGGEIDCFVASQIVGKEGQVIGVDMTQKMYDLANDNKATVGAENVEFRLAQIDETGIESNSVDVIISNCVIVLAPDKDAVFREAVRILRSGGRMHISDVMLRSILPTTVVTDMDNWTQCIAGAELLDNYINMMVDAGFSSVEIVSDKPFKAEGDEGWTDSVRSINILAVK
ncbi:methyltransferase domain-containing protein [Dehalococcoidia bacterium]|nr:methyltransferase domain-containing protein [Dehalococcoidia bacterium]